MAKKKVDKQVQVQSVIDFDLNKFDNFNATVTELRTGIFAPIDKVSANSQIYKSFVANKRSREIETSWGSISITGNILTQTHRDLMDCIMKVSEQPVHLKSSKDGGVAYYFSIGDLVREYNKKVGKEVTSNNYTWIKQKLREILNTSIEIKKKDSRDHVAFNMLRKTGFSENTDSFGIVFSEDYKKYIEDNVTVDYGEALDSLLKVQSALLRAIVRFFWTHKHINISVEQLLKSIGFPMESVRTLSSAKKEIRDNAEMLKNNFGIFYNKKDNFLYTKENENIIFRGATKYLE